MTFSPYAIPIWIAVVFIASLGTVIFWGGHRFSAKIFALSTFCLALLTASIAYFLFETDYRAEAFGIKLIFFLGFVSTTSLLYFFASLRKNAAPKARFAIILLIILGVLFYLTFFTSEIAGLPLALVNSPIGMTWAWNYGPLGFIDHLIIFGYSILSVVFAVQAYKANPDLRERRNIVFMTVGFLIGVIAQFIFNGILPQMGTYQYAWLGATSGIVWVSIIGYSIIRYNQMNVRVVTTEIFILAVCAIGFINIFIGDVLGLSGRIFLCVCFVILGAFLIRGSIRESEQREQLKNMNFNLQTEVEEQTREIRKSYEIERNARMELEKVDQAKNQFIMITQHHLRTPITSIKWQLESIMNGTYGPAAMELKKALSDMGESVERLNHLINSLLSISALKAGIETLTKERTNMNDMIEDILKELHKEIDRRHLKVSVSSRNQPWPLIMVDPKRMREVMFIFVENAVRYNIEAGSINIEGHANESKFELAIENTGIELSPEEKSKMFSELFYRSPQAQVAHPTGMGIGLSMAQAIVEAHGGIVSLSSRKTGGGVRAAVVLPY